MSLATPIIRRAARFKATSLARENSGLALVEFALLAPMLAVLFANMVDFSRLIWSQMQVDYSAQIGAQAAFKACANGTMPATPNCASLGTSVTQAVQSTSLGNSISVASGYPAETYYCTSGTTLHSVGTYSSPPNPFDCSSVGSPGVTPGDYIQVQVSYSYSPLFGRLSLVSATTQSSQALERLQ